MTHHGKLNFYAMLGLPAAATLAAVITPAFEGYGATYGVIFVMNLLPMLIAGAVSGLYLRSRVKKGGSDTARLIAISATLVPAVTGSVWYLFRAVFPAAVAPGAEFMSMPQYLLGAVILMCIATPFLGLFART